ncbi:MAG: PAS domain S-box protein [Dehalococcoidia bacterium]
MAETRDDGSESNSLALEEAELRTRAILDTVVDGIITIDSMGTIDSFNRAAEQIFGYTSAEVAGKNVSMLMPAPYADEHDGYLKSYRETRVAKIIGIGRIVEGLRKDGSTFPLELAVSGTALPGREVFTGIVRDISERVQAEQDLRDAEERMRAIVETAVDGIIVIDEQGLIETMNPAAERLFGYKLDEIRGTNVSGLMPPPFRDEHDSYLANYIRTGIAKIIGIGREVVGLRKDGTTFPMDLAVSSTNLKHRRLFTGIVRDISERKRSEAALREAQKLESLGVLAGGIAHDFNNLLVGVIGNAGLAMDELSPESPARALIREIEVTGKRAAELAHQMLAYSGKGRFSIEPLDVNAIVQEMTHLLSVSIRKGVLLRYNLSPGIPAVEADPTQIRQVVMNLIINASDAIGDRSGVTSISTGVMSADKEYLTEAYLPPDLPEGDYVFLEVSDTGEGMTREVRDKIFDPFFTTKFTGRGLGLAVVLGVVRGHRGAIKVYSEPGHGTTFKVLFPVHGDYKSGQPAATPKPGVWQTTGLALVVDDDETVRTITRRALQGMGLTVLTAEDGNEGVEVFRQHKDEIRLVILDLTMPHMSGEDAFREMRRIRSDATVVIMSGYNEDETSQRFAGKGVAAFVQKPYEVAKLRERLRELLEKQERDRP